MFGSSQTALIDEIKGFAKLERGWNSHRAPRISERVIKTALEVLDVVARRHAPMPSAAPIPSGGIALTWEIPARQLEAQLLIDEESIEYSVAHQGHPKVIDQGTLAEIYDVEKRFIARYLSM
jgi:hypothetical protein